MPRRRPPPGTPPKRPGRPRSATTRFRRPPDEADEAYARVWDGVVPPMAPGYAHEINLAEPGSGRAHAEDMGRRIQALLDRGGWNQSERDMLYQAQRKWRRRAAGEDPRYILTAGAVRGLQPRRLEVVIQTLQRGQEVEDLCRQVIRRLTGQEGV